MRVQDCLLELSIDDLRTLAERRGLLFDTARTDRKALVTAVAYALEHQAGIYQVLDLLNARELLVYTLTVLHPHLRRSAALAAELKVPLEQVEEVLAQLRRWGLVFSRGNWGSLLLPSGPLLAYLDSVLVRDLPLIRKLSWNPPPLDRRPWKDLNGRPGSIWRDLAEMLGRAARGRVRITQSGTVHRRDVRALEQGLSIPTPPFVELLLEIAHRLSLVRPIHDAQGEAFLQVQESVDDFLGAEPGAREEALFRAWLHSSGSAGPLPAYTRPHLHLDRLSGMALLLARSGTRGALSVEQLSAALEWQVPRRFYQWGENYLHGSDLMTPLLQSAWCMGWVLLDDPDNPQTAALSDDGLRVLASREGLDGPRPNGPPPTQLPEDRQFILQPNADCIAPPNLAPRTLFHLRRLTGEHRKAAAGTYPLTLESLRRAFESGVSPGSVVPFLEEYSRTGVPSNIRTLVETAARGFGRVRLVPAEWVLVTDEPVLLRELQGVPAVARVLGAPLTERSVTVDDRQRGALLRTLRQRGYAPQMDSDPAIGPPLPSLTPARPQTPPQDGCSRRRKAS